MPAAYARWIETGAAYEELLARGRIERPDPFSFDENAICELFYTSGSTGTPKGVMLSHRTLYLHALAVVAGTFVHDDRQRGAAHHPAVPRQRLGPRPRLHHDAACGR